MLKLLRAFPPLVFALTPKLLYVSLNATMMETTSKCPGSSCFSLFDWYRLLIVQEQVHFVQVVHIEVRAAVLFLGVECEQLHMVKCQVSKSICSKILILAPPLSSPVYFAQCTD